MAKNNPILVVEIDTAEKIPFSFPRRLVTMNPKNGRAETFQVEQRKVNLPHGDYRLGEPWRPTLVTSPGSLLEQQARLEGDDGCVVERKRGIRELFDNCMTKDRPRFVRALDRLAANSSRPLMIVEGTPSRLLTPVSDVVDQPGVVLAHLFRLLAERGIMFTCVPNSTVEQRFYAGEFVLLHLLHSARVQTDAEPRVPLVEDKPPSTPTAESADSIEGTVIDEAAS